MGYGDRLDTANVVRAYRALDPYVIVPHWNSRGQPVLGTYDDGAWRRCQMVSGYKRCNFLSWPEMWAGYARPQVRDNAWHGTLLKDKSDGSGLSYRRNRYYDPASGRFTQEDPTGIAGGINVYGFAAGDPVNFSDPYGLCPEIAGTTAPCSFFAVVMGEARGASRDFQVAVANVIRNRATAIGGDYERVIWAPNQFDAMSEGDANFRITQEVLLNGTVTQQVRDVVEGVYTGQIGDSTDGALLYYSPQSMRPAGRKPGWNFGQLEQTLDLGNEGKFYKCDSGTSCWQRPPANKPVQHSSGGYPTPDGEDK
jgi:RHS repeat-associated protein